MAKSKNDNNDDDNQSGESEVEEMLRWEDDGGQNVGSDYEWLPATLQEKSRKKVASKTKPPRIKSPRSASRTQNAGG